MKIKDYILYIDGIVYDDHSGIQVVIDEPLTPDSWEKARSSLAVEICIFRASYVELEFIQCSDDTWMIYDRRQGTEMGSVSQLPAYSDLLKIKCRSE